MGKLSNGLISDPYVHPNHPNLGEGSKSLPLKLQPNCWRSTKMSIEHIWLDIFWLLIYANQPHSFHQSHKQVNGARTQYVRLSSGRITIVVLSFLLSFFPGTVLRVERLSESKFFAPEECSPTFCSFQLRVHNFGDRAEKWVKSFAT